MVFEVFQNTASDQFSDNSVLSVLKPKYKNEFSRFFLIFGLTFFSYLRENFLLAVESKSTIFGFEKLVESF